MKVLIAEDPKSIAILEMARKAAKSPATVLISGETGVGKELLARFIHHYSSFNEGPFVSINCAALPDNMIEAILFGYEKGSFTNAINSYVGKFEQAQNGTLLLDEISELPIALQGKLLRVLQEREIERLGGKKLIEINVRVIAATNRDLHQLAQAGSFRSDLYYRLNVIPVHFLPLRSRKLDIIPIAKYLIEQHAVQIGRVIPILTHAATEKLLAYNWPGNIREMDNVIQRALIMTDGEVISDTDLLLMNQENEVTEQAVFTSKLEANEAKIIIEVLTEAAGCRSLAARKLNMSPRTLRYKISKLKSVGLIVP